jgi:hypothetical protein
MKTNAADITAFPAFPESTLLRFMIQDLTDIWGKLESVVTGGFSKPSHIDSLAAKSNRIIFCRQALASLLYGHQTGSPIRTNGAQ